jgi:isocitrate dehydrogenase kinase/phosphatase
VPVLIGARRTPSADVVALARSTAEAILEAFDGYLAEFATVTRRAAQRFETRDWRGRTEDDIERLGLYDAWLDRIGVRLRRSLELRVTQVSLWEQVKEEFLGLLAGRQDAERAETFYNSVTRNVFRTIGVNREIEFFRWQALPTEPFEGPPVHRTYRGGGDTRDTIRRLLSELAPAVPYEDLERDATLVAQEVDLHVWPLTGHHQGYAIEVIGTPFYRNKLAYLIGRIRTDAQLLPLILPLCHGDHGMFVDAVLLAEAEASVVFSFAFSHFSVDVDRPEELIEFVRSILPHKPVAELYNSIGLTRQGKTEFYRDLHGFVHRSRERFVIAPGHEGAVMMVFTLPSFHFVFKVIKDRPGYLRSPQLVNKTISRREVMERYDFVATRDRAGRLVDTQEFMNLRFRRRRFDSEVLDEFRLACRDTVSFDGEHVVIRHAYVQRRVEPLPLYLESEKDPETIRGVVLDFGLFLKDLAAAGIFPSDLFNTWNYGVTRRRRVVLFDYDDVIPLEQASFLIKPEPRDEVEEMEAEEERIVAGPYDFFIDELRSYTGVPQPLKALFESVHGDLFDINFWRAVQQQVSEGELADITPYRRNDCFRANRRSAAGPA